MGSPLYVMVNNIHFLFPCLKKYDKADNKIFHSEGELKHELS